MLRSAAELPSKDACRRGRSIALKRVALVGASAFVAVNIWTGAPLLALWVGSHLVRQTTPSMRGVAIVVAVLAAVVFSLAFLLAWLNRSYLDLVQAERKEHRGHYAGPLADDTPNGWRRRWLALNPIERIVVLSVYLSVFALLAWFFLLAGSPLPG